MDFLKKAATDFAIKSALEKSDSPSSVNAAAPSGNETAQQAPKKEMDYGDKAFDMITKKAGYDLSPEKDEMITDGIRGAYEKFSGTKVDPKYSN